MAIITSRNLLPTMLTLSSAFCGFLGLAFVITGKPAWAAALVIVAGIIDFSDGFVARLIKGESELGKQLDSLADMLSFGVVPGIIALDLMQKAAPFEHWIRIYRAGDLYSAALWVFVFTACALLRLAIFNISTNQKTTFSGLPSPAAAFYIASISLVINFDLGHVPVDATILEYYMTSGIYVLSSAILLGLFMILPIPFFSLKIKGFNMKDNLIQVAFFVITLSLLPFFRFLTIQIVLALYILYALISFLLKSFAPKSANNEI